MGKSKAAPIEQVSKFTGGQEDILSQLISGIQGGEYSKFGESDQYQQGMGALSQLLGGFNPQRTQEAFQQQVADPARQQFQEQTLPGIREQLIGAGVGRGTGAERIQTQAGQQLESNLSGQLSGVLQQGEQMGAQQQLSSLGIAPGFASSPQQQQLQSIMSALGINSFENIQQQQQPSILSQAIGAAGTIGGAYLGGPARAAAGSQLGNIVK